MGLPIGRSAYKGSLLSHGIVVRPCEQTDACENITFPQLRLRAVKIIINLRMSIGRFMTKERHLTPFFIPPVFFLSRENWPHSLINSEAAILVFVSKIFNRYYLHLRMKFILPLADPMGRPTPYGPNFFFNFMQFFGNIAKSVCCPNPHPTEGLTPPPPWSGPW